jgi:hypothetical protein
LVHPIPTKSASKVLEDISTKAAADEETIRVERKELAITILAGLCLLIEGFPGAQNAPAQI